MCYTLVELELFKSRANAPCSLVVSTIFPFSSFFLMLVFWGWGRYITLSTLWSISIRCKSLTPSRAIPTVFNNYYY